MGENYSAVIVTHNRLKLLKECLEHVENQTAAAGRIIVVDNASEDGTTQYLREKSAADPRYTIIECRQNTGGAGGFERGIEYVCRISDREQTDCVLLMDDDAILNVDYMEKILAKRRINETYQAFAGTVQSNSAIDIWHRRRKVKNGIRQKLCPVSDYEKEDFECDIASFCGMVVDMDIIKKVGLPCGEYFIWNDDVEYSLRINKYTKFLVIPSARLNHKTAERKKKYPHRRYDWHEYYGIRNRLLYVRKHGTAWDRLINRADMFVNIVFRNWIFGILRMDGYDWKYENTLIRKAYRDADVFYVESDIKRKPEEIYEWGE
ncbi:MAG: glycosyltransferase [Lachnospiraceae bacterium]|nr:glycosyltransferase [Lachnospiraceae bacterium]